MALGEQFFYINNRIIDMRGLAVGATVAFYLTGTTNLRPVYADQSLETPLANPYTVNAGAAIPDIWLDPTIIYRVRIVALTGEVISDLDPYSPLSAASLLYVPEGTGAVLRTVQDKLEESVSVLDFMTDAQRADVTTRSFTLDVTTAIQAAVAAALAAGHRRVYFPSGLYKTTATINFPRDTDEDTEGRANWHVWGDGMLQTEIRGSGEFSAATPRTASIVNLGDDGQQSIRSCFEDLCLSGENAIVRYGLYGSRVEEHNFNRVWCRNFTVAGMSIGGNVNNYAQCEFSYNTGDGLVFNTDFATVNNANSITQCLMLANSGLGFKGSGGNGLWITDCTIEQNRKGGIFSTITAMYVRGYLEGNALDGVTFTTPAMTVKADIVLSGSLTEMSAAFPAQGVTVEACIVDPRATSDAFVWNAGAVDLTVRNCKTNQPTYVPVVGEHYNNAYKGENVTIENCTNFNVKLKQFGATTAVNNTFASTARILPMTQRNYALNDLNQWTQLVAGTTTTYRRSTNAALRQYQGCDVWEIASGASGTSDTQGFSIDAASMPELEGKTMWFGMWVLAPSADCYAVPFCSKQTFDNNPTALNTLVPLAVSFPWAAADGIYTFGVNKRGSGTGSVFFTKPLLVEMGVRRDAAAALIPKSRVWYGTAAPVAGTWDHGDTVLNSAPSAAGVPGWVCTTAGSPGTWKAMAALAA